MPCAADELRQRDKLSQINDSYSSFAQSYHLTSDHLGSLKRLGAYCFCLFAFLCCGSASSFNLGAQRCPRIYLVDSGDTRRKEWRWTSYTLF
ncbi:hypothetical protein BDV12DRAFT_48037 [Aspergillus spectabilis]